MYSAYRATRSACPAVYGSFASSAPMSVRTAASWDSLSAR